MRKAQTTFSGYQITRRHIPEDRILHRNRSESFSFKKNYKFLTQRKTTASILEVRIGFQWHIAAFLYKPQARCCLYWCPDVALREGWQQPVEMRLRCHERVCSCTTGQPWMLHMSLFLGVQGFWQKALRNSVNSCSRGLLLSSSTEKAKYGSINILRHVGSYFLNNNLSLIKVFSPTDAQMDSLKNDFKF